jgi:nucleoside-diphosphate-sugar epimerase
MRVFLTGATGTIGARVVPILIAAGHEVTGVGRTPEKRALLDRLGAHGVGVDLFDAQAVQRAVASHDVIVNLATAVPAPAWRALLSGAWREMDRVRRHVSANLVDAALAGGTVTRVVQEAFAPIYADSGDRWIDESFPLRPASYNRSVLDAEANAERFTRGGGIGVVLRFGALYGPGDPFTRQLVDGVRRGWFALFGRPESYYSFLAHEDAATAVVASLGVPAGIYNVVEHQPMRRRELAEGLARQLGVRPPRFMPSWVVHLTGSVGETLSRSLRISSRKLERASGWSPRYRTTLEGLEAALTNRQALGLREGAV